MNRLLRNGSLIVVIGASLAACMPPNPSAKKPESVEERAAYSIGYMTGKSSSAQAPSLNVDQFAAGFRDAYAKKDGVITQDEMKAALDALEKGIEAIEEHHGVTIDLDAIPMDDKKTWALLQRADTDGDGYSDGIEVLNAYDPLRK